MWDVLYDACATNQRPLNMSLRRFIDEGLRFCRGLEMHHNIEETELFPSLARRMPEFQPPFASQLKALKQTAAVSLEEKRARLTLHHRLIHDGLDALATYLQECRSGERELEMSVMLKMMDSWKGVLWEHLDEEVLTLGAENMKKYWSVNEIRQMAF